METAPVAGTTSAEVLATPIPGMVTDPLLSQVAAPSSSDNTNCSMRPLGIHAPLTSPESSDLDTKAEDELLMSDSSDTRS